MFIFECSIFRNRTSTLAFRFVTDFSFSDEDINIVIVVPPNQTRRVFIPVNALDVSFTVASRQAFARSAGFRVIETITLPKTPGFGFFEGTKIGQNPSVISTIQSRK